MKKLFTILSIVTLFTITGNILCAAETAMGSTKTCVNRQGQTVTCPTIGGNRPSGNFS